MLCPALPGLLALLGAISCAYHATAQFLSEPTDLTEAMGAAGIKVRYKQVPPGICELNPDVKSFAGYADVDPDQHIFWWFFEARNVAPADAPLTVWINGGPGSSSMIGLFQELGPCGVDYDGKPFDNPYSWTTVSNMIFIDQPTQTGFSYSIPVPGVMDPDTSEITVLLNNSCPAGNETNCGTFSKPDLTLTQNSTAAAGPNFWKTLQGFMGAFPQYSQNGFHFASESYGGHYGPIFNQYIETQNDANIPGALHIDLQSVLIGNGWFNPIVGYVSYYNITVSPGNTYDYRAFNASWEQLMYDNLYGAGGCVEQLEACAASDSDTVCSDADDWCIEHVELLFDDATGRDEYDMRYLAPDPFPYNFYADYLNQPHVLAAIGAFTNATQFTAAVGDAFALTGDDARDAGTVAALRFLRDRGVALALYAGDADYICNWRGVLATADSVGAPRWGRAGFVNVSSGGGGVHAQTKQAGNFSFTRFFESGHEVPFYQPLASLEFFQRVIAGRDVATGERVVGKCYVTLGTEETTTREGIRTFQDEVTPLERTYDTATSEPGPLWPGAGEPGKVRRRGAAGVKPRPGLGAARRRWERPPKRL